MFRRYVLVAAAAATLVVCCASDAQEQQPTSGTSGGAQCTPGMNTKECEAAQLDALFKKMDQASATTAALNAARASNSLTYRYMSAIQSAVMRNWLRPDGLPNEQCKVHVVQLPGGTIVSATVDPSCPYNDAGRLSVVNAVLRTETLPYKGFESVFQRTIILIFMPWQPNGVPTGR